MNVYRFSELNETARTRAINDARVWVVEGETDIIGDSFFYTIAKIEEVFGIKVEEGRDGLLGWEWNETYKERYESSNWLGDTEVQDDPRMLVRYLRDVSDRINSAKTYYLPSEKQTRWHVTAPSRVSKVMYGGYHGCLTGDYSDAFVDMMMTRRWDYVREGWTIFDFICDMLFGLKQRWDEELDAMTSDDAIADLLGDTFRETYYFEDGRVAEG